MYATTNLNDASNEQLTRLRNIVWLWCISEGYEDVSTGESICFTKNQKTTTFILEINKSSAELLTCIYEATEKYDYILALRKILCKKGSKQIRKQITNMVFRLEN